MAKIIGSERPDFATKVGLVLATAGSAVGLGNIWRFPVTTGNNGGAAFILIYVACVLVLGLPLMVAEFSVGRHAHTNTAQAYKQLSRHWLWSRVGQFGVFTGWFIMCYYTVVSGWALGYLVDSLCNRFGILGGDIPDYKNHFSRFVANPYLPVLYTCALVLISHFIIVRGVKRGIERVSKVLMPLLFIILLILAVSSLFTPGAREGLTFLFRPDFTKITFQTVLDAMGQAFYSLSLAMGCVCTYASYFSKDTHLIGTAFKVGLIDSFVAVMAGIIIFPAVFSTNIQPDEGASLVFIALPGVFQQAFGLVPALGYLVSVLFYFLLVIATLTSVISLHEVPTAYLAENYRLPRPKATAVVTAVCLLVATFCSLSMGPLDRFRIAGRNLFDLFDFVSGQIMLPLGGFLIALFVGWILDRRILRNQLTNGATVAPHTSRYVIILLRYFVPFAILLIFLSGMGIFHIV